MKQIQVGDRRWKVETVECRKQDLVIRIADWNSDGDEPGFDVEVYIGGIYDATESETFTLYRNFTREAARTRAIAFAQKQIAKLL